MTSQGHGSAINGAGKGCGRFVTPSTGCFFCVFSRPLLYSLALACETCRAVPCLDLTQSPSIFLSHYRPWAPPSPPTHCFIASLTVICFLHIRFSGLTANVALSSAASRVLPTPNCVLSGRGVRGGGGGAEGWGPREEATARGRLPASCPAENGSAYYYTPACLYGIVCECTWEGQTSGPCSRPRSTRKQGKHRMGGCPAWPSRHPGLRQFDTTRLWEKAW